MNFKFKPKKIIIILTAILIILTVFIVGLLAYDRFTSQDEANKNIETKTDNYTETEINTNNNTTYKTSQRIYQISKESVLSPVISDDRVMYYHKKNGNTFEAKIDGSSVIRVSSNNFKSLVKALWGPKKEKVISIIKQEDLNLNQKYLYNFKTKTSTLLDKNIRHISWAPNQDKIAYQYYNPQDQSESHISIANPDGSNWENIFKTRMKNLIIEWPSPDKIAFRTRPSGLAQSVLYIIDTNGENIKKIKQSFGLTTLWSPSGNKLLFSETDSQGKNLKLKIVDLIKNKVQEIKLKTLPEKCVWSNEETIFCAVPKKLPDDIVMPDSFYQESVSLSDNFWKIDLQKEQAELQVKPKNNYNATNLIMSKDKERILFIDRKDNLLYGLKL